MLNNYLIVLIKRQNLVQGLRGSIQFERKKKRKEEIKNPFIRWENGSSTCEPKLIQKSDLFHVEFGNFNVPQVDHIPVIEDIENDFRIFETDFINRSCVSLVGYSLLEEKYVAISVCVKKYIEDTKVIVILRCVSDVSAFFFSFIEFIKSFQYYKL